MLDFYFSATPNGWKVAIMLEECGLEYRTVLMDLGHGDQFAPEFLAISPNAKMPAIVDYDVESEPVSVFESGAILYYLAENRAVHGLFYAWAKVDARVAVLANRQSRTHGRPTQPLRQLRAAGAGLFAQALQRRV